MTKLFVHGNPETAAVWRPLIDALVERGIDDGDIALASPPGFGAPTPDSWEPTPASYVAWLVETIETVGGVVDLVGHDWGAGHTFGVAAERPDLLRSWAADCGPLIHPAYVWHDGAQAWQTPGVGEESIAAMTSMPTADLAGAYQGMGVDADTAQSMAEAMDQDMGRCILGLYRGATQPFMAELGNRLAAASSLPALIIDATEDPFVAPELVGDVVERHGTQRLVLEGHSHWWMQSAPEAAADGLIQFWNAIT